MSDPLGEGVNRGLIRAGDHIVVSLSRADPEQLQFKRIPNGAPIEGPMQVTADVAVTSANPVIAKHINDAMVLQERSAKARNNKQFKEALALLNEALELLDRKSEGDSCAIASLLNQKGHVFFDQKQYANATVHYKDAIDLRSQHLSQNNWLQNPCYPYLVGNAAISMASMGQKDEVKALLKSGLEWIELMYVGTSDVDAVAYFFDRYMQNASDMQSELLKKAVQLNARSMKV